MTEKTFDLTGAIIDFESGEQSPRGTFELFAHLIKTGTAWTLQGSYGRTAASLIESGYISRNGEITESGEDIITGAEMADSELED